MRGELRPNMNKAPRDYDTPLMQQSPLRLYRTEYTPARDAHLYARVG
jgi:hypothetical protein